MLKYLLVALILLAGLFIFGFAFKGNNSDNALISYAKLQEKLTQKEDFILLDVRTQEEFKAGHIPTAILLPYDAIEKQASKVLPDTNKEIIVYCRSGRRSAIAADTLQKLGYTKVSDFGGINRWQGSLEH